MQLKNKVIFCLDSSGSVQVIAKPIVDALNHAVEGAKANAFSTGQQTTASLYTFGERNAVICKYRDVPIEQVKPLAYSAFRPDGQTPMFDCVGQAIEDHFNPTDRYTSFLLSCITDGKENHSRRFRDPRDLKRLISKVQGTDLWTVTFMVPRGDKAGLVQQFDIPEGNVAEWTPSAQGAAEVGQAYHAGLSNYYTSRASGQTSTRGFFTPDMSQVRTSDVKRQLTDVSKLFVALRVTQDVDIKSFVEHAGFTYVRGNGYYQLTKAEKEVQPYKKILLRKRGESAIYAGAEARALLGMPEHLSLKVAPGQHGDWEIYVQSTSSNRTLKADTTLLYTR